MKQWPVVFVVVTAVVMIMAGFALENVKVSLNFIIEFSGRIPEYDSLNPQEREVELAVYRRNSPSDYYHSHKPLSFFHSFKRSDLVVLKWAVVAIAIIAFAALNAFSLWLIIGNISALRWLALVYLLIIVLGSVFFVVERAVFIESYSVAVSRKILNAGQSGIPALIVIIIFKLKLQQGYVDKLE